MSILQPGADPPFVVPFCAICDQPVERFTIDAISSPYRMGIQATCCGRTMGRHIAVEEVFRLKRSNEKLYVVVPAGRYQTIRSQARFG